jgi:hypothetical protein
VNPSTLSSVERSSSNSTLNPHQFKSPTLRKEWGFSVMTFAARQKNQSSRPKHRGPIANRSG